MRVVYEAELVETDGSPQKKKKGSKEDQDLLEDEWVKKHFLKIDIWSSGYGRRLMFQRSWVRILVPDTGWT